jgi:hypothetical protein
MFRTHITNLGNMVGTQWERDRHTLEQQKFNIPTLPQEGKKTQDPSVHVVASPHWLQEIVFGCLCS